RAMNDEHTGTLRDAASNYVALARKSLRYWKRSVLLALVVGVAGVAWAARRPRQYRSEASAAVQDLSASSALPRSNEEMQNDLRARLEQIFGSRANMGRVVDELGLYPWLRHKVSRLRVIEAFQSAVSYTTASRDAFHLQFVYKDPILAQ